MDDQKDKIKEELDKALKSGVGPGAVRYALSVVGGMIPALGGAISGAAGAWSEHEQNRWKKILATWLNLQEDEIREIGLTLTEVWMRVGNIDEKITERIESKGYLSLVKKCFRDWAAAESEEKRILLRNLLVNAAATELCTDDVIRMFIQWIADFSELHFKVIAEIYHAPGITRFGMWENVYGGRARQDSAEADLFKLLIRDLSTGSVIRQHRETDYNGNFLPKTPQRSRRKGQITTLVSAFDDEKQYELTALGKQFVHYAMSETTIKIDHNQPATDPNIHESSQA